MLAVFTAFPMFGTFQAALEKYFLQSLVPDSIARPVLRTLTQFAGKASRVGSVGLLLLGATALAMMLTIDRTLNALWRVRQPRPIAQRLLVYWAGLTLGPLALGVSLSAALREKPLVSCSGSRRTCFHAAPFHIQACLSAISQTFVGPLPNTLL